MRAEHQPDVYDESGHRPVWIASAAGDKDGEGEVGGELRLCAATFPPGTKVIVLEPICPLCGETPFEAHGIWKCSDPCEFDWREHAEARFS